jgi:hypothetical protein
MADRGDASAGTVRQAPGLAARAVRPILAGLRALGHAAEPLLEHRTV